jgi:hypothetical protein
MIEIHKDALGNVIGYFDTEAHCWVSAPQAADADDDEEPLPTAADPLPPVDWNSLTKVQIKNWLADNNIPYPHNANVSKLIEIAKEHYK